LGRRPGGQYNRSRKRIIDIPLTHH
jgi:hypothetical protein